jgi:hypothetical protein
VGRIERRLVEHARHGRQREARRAVEQLRFRELRFERILLRGRARLVARDRDLAQLGEQHAVRVVHREPALGQVQLVEQQRRERRRAQPHRREVARRGLGLRERDFAAERALARERERLRERHALPGVHVRLADRERRQLVREHGILERRLLWMARERRAPRPAGGRDARVPREHGGDERPAFERRVPGERIVVGRPGSGALPGLSLFVMGRRARPRAAPEERRQERERTQRVHARHLDGDRAAGAAQGSAVECAQSRRTALRERCGAAAHGTGAGSEAGTNTGGTSASAAAVVEAGAAAPGAEGARPAARSGQQSPAPSHAQPRSSAASSGQHAISWAFAAEAVVAAPKTSPAASISSTKRLVRRRPEEDMEMGCSHRVEVSNRLIGRAETFLEQPSRMHRGRERSRTSTW